MITKIIPSIEQVLKSVFLNVSMKAWMSVVLSDCSFEYPLSWVSVALNVYILLYLFSLERL